MDGTEIHSAERTTQGDPFAMPAYAAGIVPPLLLLKSVNQQPNDIGVKHAAYADDLVGAGDLQQQLLVEQSHGLWHFTSILPKSF